jgi:hypothetical protein
VVRLEISPTGLINIKPRAPRGHRRKHERAGLRTALRILHMATGMLTQRPSMTVHRPGLGFVVCVFLLFFFFPGAVLTFIIQLVQ